MKTWDNGNVISTTTLKNDLAPSGKFKDIHSPRASNYTPRKISNIQKSCNNSALHPALLIANILTHLPYCSVSISIKRYFFLNHVRMNCRQYTLYPQIVQHRFPLHMEFHLFNYSILIKIRKMSVINIIAILAVSVL